MGNAYITTQNLLKKSQYKLIPSAVLAHENQYYCWEGPLPLTVT